MLKNQKEGGKDVKNFVYRKVLTQRLETIFQECLDEYRLINTW